MDNKNHHGFDTVLNYNFDKTNTSFSFEKIKYFTSLYNLEN